MKSSIFVILLVTLLLSGCNSDQKLAECVLDNNNTPPSFEYAC